MARVPLLIPLALGLAGVTMADGGADEDTIKFDRVAGSNQVTGGDGIDTCKPRGSVTSSGCEEQ